MEYVSYEIGKRIRSIRKRKKITIEQLAKQIGKCRSMVSKYETGASVIDIETLYEIADTLNVSPEDLLYKRPLKPVVIEDANDAGPRFFNGTSRFYGYYFDGRSQALNKTVFEVSEKINQNTWAISVYMNYTDLANYQDCENSYRGTLEHYESMTNIRVKNISSPIEQLHISVLSNFQDDDEKWGLMCGISSRPIMPIALKMYLSLCPVKETPEFLRMLKISKADITIMRQFNMFTAMPS